MDSNSDPRRLSVRCDRSQGTDISYSAGVSNLEGMFFTACDPRHICLRNGSRLPRWCGNSPVVQMSEATILVLGYPSGMMASEGAALSSGEDAAHDSARLASSNACLLITLDVKGFQLLQRARTHDTQKHAETVRA